MLSLESACGCQTRNGVFPSWPSEYYFTLKLNFTMHERSCLFCICFVSKLFLVARTQIHITKWQIFICVSIRFFLWHKHTLHGEGLFVPQIAPNKYTDAKSLLFSMPEAGQIWLMCRHNCCRRRHYHCCSSHYCLFSPCDHRCHCHFSPHHHRHLLSAIITAHCLSVSTNIAANISAAATTASVSITAATLPPSLFPQQPRSPFSPILLQPYGWLLPTPAIVIVVAAIAITMTTVAATAAATASAAISTIPITSAATHCRHLQAGRCPSGGWWLMPWSTAAGSEEVERAVLALLSLLYLTCSLLHSLI